MYFCARAPIVAGLSAAAKLLEHTSIQEWNVENIFGLPRAASLMASPKSLIAIRFVPRNNQPLWQHVREIG
jgi:hypothetical protein